MPSRVIIYKIDIYVFLFAEQANGSPRKRHTSGRKPQKPLSRNPRPHNQNWLVEAGLSPVLKGGRPQVWSSRNHWTRWELWRVPRQLLPLTREKERTPRSLRWSPRRRRRHSERGKQRGKEWRTGRSLSWDYTRRTELSMFPSSRGAPSCAKTVEMLMDWKKRRGDQLRAPSSSASVTHVCIVQYLVKSC